MAFDLASLQSRMEHAGVFHDPLPKNTITNNRHFNCKYVSDSVRDIFSIRNIFVILLQQVVNAKRIKQVFGPCCIPRRTVSERYSREGLTISPENHFMNHFGQQVSDPGEGVFGVGEHSDFGTLTLLATVRSGSIH